MSETTSHGAAPEAEGGASARDYRDTLLLPQTDFAMRAGLPKQEPEHLKRWAEMALYRRLREDAKGRETFLLHDGPPYANGHLHMGHALNKILKDMVVRSQQMMGKDANYVPGWDCHGLPIEWKIEETYRAKGKNKDDVPVLEFRKECRDFADKWIEIQRDEFKRLGVIGDWENPYTTMDFKAEAQIVREFLKFVMNGGLYRGSKPIMWSVVEKTALAEAEVEYLDHESDTIWVKFPVVSGPPDAQGTCLVIWTTTPWTIPGNRAISYSKNIEYGVYEVGNVPEESWVKTGEKLILADALAADVMSSARVEGYKKLENIDPSLIKICAHPLRGQGYDFDVPMLAGNHVTDETGTGFVHTAPGHGREDFEVWEESKAYLQNLNISADIPFTVDAEGVLTGEAPGFEGRSVLTPKGKKGDANKAVMDALIEAGMLIARGRLKHQYPHSWRSKKPVIFRNTPQWFISMETNGLRAKALEAIDAVRFTPETGRNRLRGMVETRPDWVVSRQRAWGVPLTVFVHRESGEILRDEAVNARIVAAVEEDGADAWFAATAADFLGAQYAAQDYEMVTDILDVWFDSGCTHAFVLEARDDLSSPADLYLEGSDQHRGWFQSSLMESCGTRGAAPYRQVLTHGFLLDEKGHKMSKSGANSVSPEKVIAQNGAEILRLWVASSDFTEDLSIGQDIIKANVDSYRKIRNTLKYLLGNLHGFEAAERVAPADMPELERWVLHRLAELDANVRKSYDNFDFRAVFTHVFNFCTVDLSSIYFDIRKDSLYCDRADSIVRRACRTVLEELFSCLTAWTAPFLCFTTEEAWASRFPDAQKSVHLRQFPAIPADWRDEELAAKWSKIWRLRRVVTGALEVERREKRIGSSLEAAPSVYVTEPGFAQALKGLDLAEIVITSQATLVEGPPPAGAFSLEDVAGVAVVPARAEGSKCQRSWKILPDVGADPRYPDLSPRDADAVAFLDAAR